MLEGISSIISYNYSDRLGYNDLATTAKYLDFIGEDIKEDYRKVKW